MTSHQSKNANREAIGRMYDQMFIKDGNESQKELLYNLALANMSWLEPSASGYTENERKVGHSRQINEIIAVYNSATGDASFGISSIDSQMKKKTRKILSYGISKLTGVFWERYPSLHLLSRSLGLRRHR